MKKQHLLKKQVAIIIISMLAVLVFSFVYTTVTGSRYNLETLIECSESEMSNLEIYVDDERVLNIDECKIENGQLIVSVSGVGRGYTTLKIVNHDTFDTYDDEFEFYVNSFNTVFDITYERNVFNGCMAVVTALTLQLLLMALCLVWLFVEYLIKGDFSYSMVACGGLSIYLIILFIYIARNLLSNSYYSLTFFLAMVTSGGMEMLDILSPVMLVLSVLLVLSNIWLIRHEGFRPVNLLGVAFALLWGAGTAITVGSFYTDAFYENEILITGVFALIYIVVYMECMLLSTTLCSFLAGKYKPRLDIDYIIILGCAIRRDGSLTPLLKGRVDSAVAFEKKQYEATGKHAVFVPSGGQGSDEVISEGEAMENYLKSIGVPSEQIIREDRSVNTNENLAFSKKVIFKHARRTDSKIAFSTTNYHVFRSYILAKKNGLKVKGISAKTKPYFFPNAFLREFVGLLVDKKWQHLLFIGLTVFFFIFLIYI